MPPKKEHDCGQKSHVGFQICCICQKEMGLLLDRRGRDSLCRKNMFPGEVCPECENTYLKEGILCMNPKTGSMAVIKDEALARILNDQPGTKAIYQAAVSKRRVFMEEPIIQWLIAGAPVSPEGNHAT